MADRLSEAEIQERIKFKLNDIKDSLKNAVSRHFHLAVTTVSQKHANYWEAFKLFDEMFEKEINMPLPYNHMAEKKFKMKRDELVKKISERFNKRGRYYDSKEQMRNDSFIANIIEEAMLWDEN